MGKLGETGCLVRVVTVSDQSRGIQLQTARLDSDSPLEIRSSGKAKYWSLVTTNGDNGDYFNHAGIQRNTQVELNEMVPRGGLEPPTHGFSILPNDSINAFLDDRISRGLSVSSLAA